LKRRRERAGRHVAGVWPRRTVSSRWPRVTGYASAGGEPKDLFFAPIVAVAESHEESHTTIGDYDLIEANEAFAVQAIADGPRPGLGLDRVNVNGGAIASGTRSRVGRAHPHHSAVRLEGP